MAPVAGTLSQTPSVSTGLSPWSLHRAGWTSHVVTQRPPKHEPHCYQADGQCHCHHIPSLKHEDKPRFEEAKQILVPNGEVTKNLHHLYSPPPKGGVNSGSKGAPTVHPSVGELKKHSQGALLEAKSVPGAEVPSLKGRCPPPPPWGNLWPGLCIFVAMETKPFWRPRCPPSGSLLRRKSSETRGRGESLWEREMLLELPRAGFLALLNQGRKVLEINRTVFESRTSQDQSQGLEWVTRALHTS